MYLMADIKQPKTDLLDKTNMLTGRGKVKIEILNAIFFLLTMDTFGLLALVSDITVRQCHVLPFPDEKQITVKIVLHDNK